MELDQFSTRRIEPDKPLWHFYLTRYSPPSLIICPRVIQLLLSTITN